MARQTKPLNNTEVKNSKATERATILYDGDGLELLVKPVAQNSGDSAITNLSLANAQ